MGLFSGSAKSKAKTEVTPYTSLHNNYLNRLWDLSWSDQTFFPGQTYAGVDPLQSEALGLRESYARGMQGDVVAPMVQAWQGMLNAPDVANNPYVQGMLDQQANLLNRNLAETMPMIEANMLGVNQRLGGSGQGIASGIAARGTQEALNRFAAQTQLDAYRQGLTQQRYGLGQTPSVANMSLMPGDLLMGIGGFNRAEGQRAIDEAMARHQFEQEQPWRRMERFANLWNPAIQPYATTTRTTESSASPSAFQIGGQLAGLGMAGYGMFGGGGLGLGNTFANMFSGGAYGRALPPPPGIAAAY